MNRTPPRDWKSWSVATCCRGSRRDSASGTSASAVVARSLDDQPRLGYLFNYRCIDLQLLGRYEEAARAGEDALALAAAVGDFTLEIEASSHLGRACHGRGDFQRARVLLEHAV